MEEKLPKFIKKYYIIIIISFIHPLLYLTQSHWSREVIFTNGFGNFRVWDFYLLYIWTASHFIYGILTYIITKEILIPHAIPTVIYFICYGIMNRGNTHGLEIMLNFTFFPMVLSLFTALITKGIHAVIKGITASKKRL